MLILLVGITGVVVALDQAAKYLAFKQDVPLPILGGIVDIVHAKNEGIAFGIGTGIKHAGIILSVLSVATIAFLLVFFFRYTRRRIADTMAISLIIGGAIGNLIDRILNTGRVLDFIQLRFINWPAFNFADLAIVVGVIVLIFTIAFDHAEHPLKHSQGSGS